MVMPKTALYSRSPRTGPATSRGVAGVGVGTPATSDDVAPAPASAEPVAASPGAKGRVRVVANLSSIVQFLPEDVAAPAGSNPGVAAEVRCGIALALDRLPPKLRIAAAMAVVEEMPHKEVAAALGISVAAVKVRVFRALRLLRRDLEQQGIRP